MYNENMLENYVDTRLKELGIYSEYYYRLELKSLKKLINIDETLNCVLTGILDGCRRMIAVTDYRILIISASALASGEVITIDRKAVKSWKFTKKFLLSTIEIETNERNFLFKMTQAAREKLFNDAMQMEIKQFDE